MSSTDTTKVKISEEWTRKYRPVDLTSYIGNATIKQMLTMNALKGTIPQKLMFYGHYGSGKTTVARIASKYIQCLNPLPDGSPCNVCKTCQDINEKLILNAKSTGGVIEYNMSELTKKSDVSIIMDKIKVVPPAPYKKFVIILDEIQELSSSAQQSMLKILEEPPKNVYFIICTTNPEKLLPTVKSRVQQFRVTRPTVSDLMVLLEDICKNEGVKYTKQGLRMIASRNRVPRDSIKLLESVAKTLGSVTAENVESLIDAVSDSIYMEYLNCLTEARKSSQTRLLILTEILDFIEKLDTEYTIEPVPFIKGLLEFLITLLNARHRSNTDSISQKVKKFSRELIPVFSDGDIFKLMDYYNDALKLITFNPEFAQISIYTTSLNFIKEGMLNLKDTKSERTKENRLAEFNHLQLEEKKNQESIEEYVSSELELENLTAIFTDAVILDDEEQDNQEGLFDLKSLGLNEDEIEDII